MGPPLPPGKTSQIQAKQDSNLQDVDAWDPNADLLDFDDDITRDALSGAPTAPGSEPGTAPASRQQKKRNSDKAHSTVCVRSCVSPCVCARLYVSVHISVLSDVERRDIGCC